LDNIFRLAMGMPINFITLSPMASGNNHRIAIHNKAYVANHCGIKNSIYCLLFSDAALGTTNYARPLTG
jgi:hypothetical protein